MHCTGEEEMFQGGCCKTVQNQSSVLEMFSQRLLKSIRCKKSRSFQRNLMGDVGGFWV